MAAPYKLTSTGYILRVATGCWIPPDQSNTDYRAYLAWVAAGNTPDPADPPPSTPTPIRAMFGRPVNGVSSNGAVNTFVGQAINDTPAGAQIFPTAVTGYAELHSAGSQAFGLFGRADLFVPGTAVNEVDAFNHSGAPATALPPNLGFGTPDNNAIALIHAAYGENPASIADYVALGDQPFVIGYYVGPGAATRASEWLDAQGNTVNLVLRTTDPPQPSNAVILVYDQNQSPKFVVKQSGDVWANLVAPGVYTVATLPAAPAKVSFAFASNGLKPGETASHGTGVPVFWDGSKWCSFCSGAPVQA